MEAEAPEPEEVPKIVWRWIDLAFSEPVDREDSTVDYVPTQIIAELFKTNGFGGVKYRSGNYASQACRWRECWRLL